VISKEVLLAWADEAAHDDDPVLAALLLQLATLRGYADHWSIEMLKRIADLRVSEAEARLAREDADWPEVIDV